MNEIQRACLSAYCQCLSYSSSRLLYAKQVHLLHCGRLQLRRHQTRCMLEETGSLGSIHVTTMPKLHIPLAFRACIPAPGRVWRGVYQCRTRLQATLNTPRTASSSRYAPTHLHGDRHTYATACLNIQASRTSSLNLLL